MLRKVLAFVVMAGVSGVTVAENIPQSVTSEVFYSQDTETETVQEPQYVELAEPEYERADMVQESEPVWPIAGSDADVVIECEDGDCDKHSNSKIITKIGSGLIIENNINTKGTGWSGGPNIINDAPIPAGFDYECSNEAEMPLLRREMMEDDGGTVLAVSRSPRTMCNKSGDSYAVFAEKAGFSDGVKTDDSKAVSEIAIQDSRQEIVVQEYVDAEEKAEVQDQVRSWVVANGQTLRQVLQSWCDKEGWDLVWTSSREYPIEASAIFKGRFIDVASALVRNFERATPIPYAKFYKGNRVVVVSTNEE